MMSCYRDEPGRDLYVGDRMIFNTGHGFSMEITVTDMTVDTITGALVHRVIPDEHHYVTGVIKLPPGWTWATDHQREE